MEQSLTKVTSLWAQTRDAIIRHQKVLVTLLILVAAVCLLYYHGRSTKTIGRVVPLAPTKTGSGSTQYHVDFPNSRIVASTSDQMMRIPETNEDRCRQQCEDTDWCHFWEHDGLDNACQLYKSISRSSNYEASIVPHNGSSVGVFERKLTGA
jgi:hypothetical protein